MLTVLDAAQRAPLHGRGPRAAVQPRQLAARTRPEGRTSASGTKSTSATLLTQAVEQPVFKENDGNAAAIAELFFGVRPRGDDFLYVFLGSALGAGAVIGGESLRGVSGNAARPRPDAGAAQPPALGAAAATAMGHPAFARVAELARAPSAPSRHQVEQPRRSRSLRQARQRRQCANGSTTASTRSCPPCARRCACSTCRPSCIDCDIDGGLHRRLLIASTAGLRLIAPEARQTPAPPARQLSAATRAPSARRACPCSSTSRRAPTCCAAAGTQPNQETVHA